MTIKLKGSSDGSVSLTAPADTSPSGTDITLTLPTDAGSANQFIKNSGTAGTLDYSSMVETSTGIGIGTTSPLSGANLTVAGEGLAITGQNTAHSANSIRIGEEGSGLAQIRCYGPDTSTNGSLTVRTSRSDGSNSQDVTIDNGGRVGIGSSSVNSSRKVEITQPNGYVAGLRIMHGGSGAYNQFFSGVSNWRVGSPQSTNALTFDEGSTSTERLRINSQGYITVSGPTNYSNIQFKANGTVKGYVGPAGFIGGSDTDMGMRAESGGAIVLYNGSAEKARLNSGGNFLVGTTTADGFKFKVLNGAGTIARFTDGTSQTLDIRQASGGIELQNPNNGFISFKGSSAERMRLDASGRLLLGNTSSFNGGIVCVGSGQGSNSPSGDHIKIGPNANRIEFLDTNSNTSDTGSISFYNTVYNTRSAEIQLHHPAANTGGIKFKTHDGTSLGERMSIDNLGNVFMTTVSGGQEALTINRQVADGTLISFQQAGTFEGNIAVSGSTVSYNGAHLTRWSQLPGNAERITILRGTVLSNIDEMCEWGDEDNEQLNRTKVSEVEGDPNVAGVFQSWDDSDEVYTNDFYCAMTGDFIIRIAQGTTVARGDLLMSAGDGTAKPQDDDIVRSKTIAKVTSTNVTCTYDDGSYCVPCVLMAC